MLPDHIVSQRRLHPPFNEILAICNLRLETERPMAAMLRFLPLVGMDSVAAEGRLTESSGRTSRSSGGRFSAEAVTRT